MLQKLQIIFGGKLSKILVLLLITTAVPLTVLIAQQQQNTQQKASGPQEETIPTKLSEHVPGEVIIKFKDTTLQNIFKAKNTQSINFQEVGDANISTSLKSVNDKYKIGTITKVFKDKQIKTAKPTSTQQAFVDSQETQRLEQELSKIYKITLVEKTAVEETIKELSQDPNVEYAEPNYIYHIQADPNDPYFIDRYPDNISGRDPSWNPPHDYQWNIKKTNSNSNWEKDVSSIVVAVIDSGVDITHPDLGNVWVNPSEIGGDGIDNDQNGCIDDVNGCNFVSGLRGNIADDDNHGTHVAGVISAKTNNQLGLAGITSNAKIMAVKTMDENGSGLADGISAGIKYAADNGARVLNMSIGGSQSQTMKDALDYAVSKGVIPVIAAGNGNSYSPTNFPASYKPGITVSGVDEELNKMRYSNYGPNIDVAAPGGGKPCMYHAKPSYCSNILSLKSSQNSKDQDLVVGEKYLRLSGTSMATPHVAGIVALLLAQHPTWGITEIENYIRFNSLDPNGTGQNEKTGWGIINATGTTIVPPSNIDFVINYPAENALIGRDFTVAGTIKADNFDHFEVSYRLKGSPWSTENVQLVGSERNQIITTQQLPIAKIATVTLPANSQRGIYEIKTTLFMTNGKSLSSTKTVNFLAKPGTAWFPVENNTPPNIGKNMLIADLNNDGQKEIILYDNSSLQVFDNKYNLLWQKEITEGNARRGEVVIGDVDRRNPGKEVLWAVKKSNGETGSIFVHDANGNLISDMTYPNAGNINESNYLVLDADANGISELYFIGSGLHSIEQNAQNQFVEKWKYQLETPSSSERFFFRRWPIGGNITGDGFSDIVIINNGKLKVINHLGGLAAEYPIGSIDSMVLGDMDKDGKEDIITHTQWGDTKLLKFTNDNLVLAWSFNSSGNAESLSLADFNNDGFLDVYLLIGGDGVPYPAHILNHQGQLLFSDKTWPIYFSASWLGFTSLADRNNDSNIELYQAGNVGVDQRQYLNVLEYNYQTNKADYIDGDWKATIPQWTSLEPSGYFGNPLYPIAITDLENNGKLDLVIAGVGIIEYETQGKVYWPYKYHDYQRTNSYNFIPDNTTIPTPTPTLTVYYFGEFLEAFGTRTGDAKYNLKYDYNKDGRINIIDFSALLYVPFAPASIQLRAGYNASELLSTYGKTSTDSGFNTKYDINTDNVVNYIDYTLLNTSLSPTPATPVGFSLSPNTANISSGQTFTVDIALNNSANYAISGVDLDLNFSNNVLTLQSFTPSSFLNSKLTNIISNDNGTLRYVAVETLQPTSQQKYNLGTLTFVAKNPGIGSVQIQNTQITAIGVANAIPTVNNDQGNYTVLQNQTPTATPTVIISPTTTPITGDANGDGTVDILDYNIWRDEFLGILTTKRSDFNNDNVIDLLDFNIWRNAFSP